MKRILTTLSAAILAVVSFSSDAKASGFGTFAPFPVSTSIGEIDISMSTGSFVALGNPAPFLSKSALALEAANSFLDRYIPPTSGTLPTRFAATSGFAYAFAYAVREIIAPSVSKPFGLFEVDAHVAVFEGGVTATPSNPGDTGVYQGVSFNVSQGITTFQPGPGPSGNDPDYTVNWASLTNGQEFVPEIDGPVLVQVGFALMGLYVLMLGRRRREDEMSGTPLAA